MNSGFKIVMIAAVVALFAPAVASGQDAGDDDSTPIGMCAKLPAQAVIEAMSQADAVRICRAISLLPDVRVKDVRLFSKAAAVLASEGYEGELSGIAGQLMVIIKLRGLNSQPDRWHDNLDIVVRAYQVFNGVVTPANVITFLRSAGPVAKTLSDEGFLHMLAYLKESLQGGD